MQFREKIVSKPTEIYELWTRMWNGELDIADELLAENFAAHLTADSLPPPAMLAT